MTPPSIPVLLCANGVYFQHMAVTVASLLTNNRAHRFDLTIATDRDYPAEQKRLQAMIDGFGNATARFVVFDSERIARLPIRLHLTALTYVRLFAAELFDDNVERVLYLDTDLVVCDDIAPLWSIDMGDKPLAGALDIFIDAQRAGAAKNYINAGVLLLNLRQWRAENAGEKLIGYIDAHTDLPYLDQDALNQVFAGRIQIVPLRWNFQARMAHAGAKALGLARAEFIEMRRNPGIVHYTTGSKPWMYRKSVPYTGLYYRYLAMTPWSDYRAPDKTLRRQISQAVRLMKLKRWIKWVMA
jgi:lipopolysaccharide biosynthesis glycosyltransferase